MPTITIPQYEPKRQFRWMVSLPRTFGDGTAINTAVDENVISTYARSTGRPRWTQTEKEIPYIASRRYLLNRRVWEPFAITFHDDETNLVMKYFQAWADKCYPKDDNDAYDGTMAGNFIEYSVGSIQLDLINASGSYVERWHVKDVMMAGLEPSGASDLSYDSDDPLNLTLTFRFVDAHVEYPA
jgi:hypothetical protein